MKTEISVGGGKYVVRIDEQGNMDVLTYGEPRQDLTGNNLVCCLAVELHAERNKNQSLQEKLLSIQLPMTKEELKEILSDMHMKERTTGPTKQQQIEWFAGMAISGSVKQGPNMQTEALWVAERLHLAFKERFAEKKEEECS